MPFLRTSEPGLLRTAAAEDLWYSVSFPGYMRTALRKPSFPVPGIPVLLPAGHTGSFPFPRLRSYCLPVWLKDLRSNAGKPRLHRCLRCQPDPRCHQCLSYSRHRCHLSFCFSGLCKWNGCLKRLGCIRGSGLLIRRIP